MYITVKTEPRIPPPPPATWRSITIKLSEAEAEKLACIVGLDMTIAGALENILPKPEVQLFLNQLFSELLFHEFKGRKWPAKGEE